MPENNGALLSAEDRAEVLRMFNEMKTGYGTLDAALKAGKPVGEIKTFLEKVTADVVAMQEKYAALDKYAKSLDETIVQLKKGGAFEPPKTISNKH